MRPAPAHSARSRPPEINSLGGSGRGGAGSSRLRPWRETRLLVAVLLLQGSRCTSRGPARVLREPPRGGTELGSCDRPTASGGRVSPASDPLVGKSLEAPMAVTWAVTFCHRSAPSRMLLGGSAGGSSAAGVFFSKCPLQTFGVFAFLLGRGRGGKA